MGDLQHGSAFVKACALPTSMSSYMKEKNIVTPDVHRRDSCSTS